MANLVVGHVSPLSWAGFRDDVFGRLESEMDKFLSDMINPKAVQRMKGDNYPKTDIYKDKHNLVFQMVVPFCKKEDIKITLDEGILTISGGAYDNTSPFDDKREFLVKEIRRSSFIRAWSIPDGDMCLSEDDIIAEMKDGILTISVVDYFADDNKAPKPQKKEIKIK